MRTDEFHESYLPAKVEGNHQAVVPSRDLEPYALAVQYLILALGAACLTSSVDIQCAALTSLCQRSRKTFVSGWSAHDLVLCIT
jgi:hypothetical protein